MALLEEPIKEVKVLKNYIDGEWVDSKGEIVDVINPATCQTISKVPVSTKEEIDAAVEAAKAAFPDWRRTTPLAWKVARPDSRSVKSGGKQSDGKTRE